MSFVSLIFVLYLLLSGVGHEDDLPLCVAALWAGVPPLLEGSRGATEFFKDRKMPCRDRLPHSSYLSSLSLPGGQASLYWSTMVIPTLALWSRHDQMKSLSYWCSSYCLFSHILTYLGGKEEMITLAEQEILSASFTNFSKQS